MKIVSISSSPTKSIKRIFYIYTIKSVRCPLTQGRVISCVTYSSHMINLNRARHIAGSKFPKEIVKPALGSYKENCFLKKSTKSGNNSSMIFSLKRNTIKCHTVRRKHPQTKIYGAKIFRCNIQDQKHLTI